MSAKGERKQSITNNPPRTPSRRGAQLEKEPTPPSSDTLSSSGGKQGTLSTDEDGDTVAPPHPFLAYARRVRSFSSPLKVNRARYLLTFVDAEAAQEWWKLMQQEYPDSVRESDQLFSFKSDRVPAKARGNPQFAHLNNKWTFRQLEDKESQGGQDKRQTSPKRTLKRGSLMRMLSTPSLGPIGEGPQINHVQPEPSLPEDPFTEPTPPRSEQSSIDLLELNRTLDRMMMMMNQTNLRIDALAEQQRTYSDSLNKLREALEANSDQLQTMTTQSSAGAVSTKNMRNAIEQNAGHVKTILERQTHDSGREERLDRKLSDCTRGIDLLAESQRVSRADLQHTKSIMNQTADRVQTILDRQNAGEEKLNAIISHLEQSSPAKKPPPTRSPGPTPTPSAGSIQRLQTAIEQQSAQLAGLIKAQKSTEKAVQKAQSSLENLPPPPSHDAHENRLQQRMDEMQTAHEQGMTELRETLLRTMAKNMEKTDVARSRANDRIIKVLGARSGAAEKKVVQCDHDVAPGPRKMNKELLGYWYKRQT